MYSMAIQLHLLIKKIFDGCSAMATPVITREVYCLTVILHLTVIPGKLTRFLYNNTSLIQLWMELTQASHTQSD